LEQHKIVAVRNLTRSTFVLRLERKNLQFQTGQFIVLKYPGSAEKREYSVYSGENDDYLEVLVREIEGGKVSGRLKKLTPGAAVEVEGPFGFFRFHPEMFPSKKFLFVATGTGISPFHSFVRTFPALDYRLVHGVRYVDEAYDHADYEPHKIILCTSGDAHGQEPGRVTGYLPALDIEPGTQCFLCGSSAMIYDVFDILKGKGIPAADIYSEVYY
jgi:ferredoxin/flavodoxin---NADP+ reductase